MIKSWKLFLENDSHGSDEMKNHGEELKSSLKNIFKPLFLNEKIMRHLNYIDELKQSVDMVYESLMGGFEDAIDGKFQDDQELSGIIKSYFGKSLDRAKIVMVEKSIEEGIEFMIDEFVKLMIELKDAMDSEGDEWKEEKERDYSELSQREIQKLIDDALDERDFKRVEFLSKYLKESLSPDLKTAIEEITEQACNLFVEFVLKYFSNYSKL